MFDNVIVGVDERDSRTDAIKLAMELLAPGGTVTFAHVYEQYVGFVQGQNTIGSVQELLHEREQALLHGAANASVATLESASVGRGLHELADKIEADLLVLGSTRHGTIGRVLVGDHTRDAINGARCAVAVAPAGYAATGGVIATIGIGYDESHEARHALSVGRKLAAECGAELSLLEAIPLPVFAETGDDTAYAALAPVMLASATQELEKLDGVKTQAAVGDPARELSHFSASLDLLILGSRSFGPLGRLVHSSTSQRMSRKARCPLLILPRAAESQEVDAADSDIAGALG